MDGEIFYKKVEIT